MPMPVVGVVMIGLGIFFLMLYLAGISIGSGIIGMIKDIHPIGWLIIFLFILFWSTRGKK